MTRRTLLELMAIMAGTLAGLRSTRASETKLVLLLRSRQPRYALDLGGRTAEPFLAALEVGIRNQRPIQDPPVVDLTVEVQNADSTPVEFWVSGDPVVLDLDVQGPAVRSVKPALMFTADWRHPRPKRLNPGERHAYEITRLWSGWRDSDWHYWTRPGTYTLTASLRTGLGPVPRDVHGDSAPLRLTSNPVTVEVG